MGSMGSGSMKLRRLTYGEIERLASRPNVRRIAVENFLSTMGEDYYIAVSNLNMDRKLYKWNRETVKAIMDGIKMAMEEGIYGET